MAKIITDNDQSGEAKFFNLAVKNFLQQHRGKDDKAITQLQQCINSESAQVYLATLGEAYCELIAINKDGKERYFKLDLDENFQVQNVNKLNESSLSSEGHVFLEHIRAGGSPAFEANM